MVYYFDRNFAKRKFTTGECTTENSKAATTTQAVNSQPAKYNLYGYNRIKG
jgi:hypothetical protein